MFSLLNINMQQQYRIYIPIIAALMILVCITVLLWPELRNDVDVFALENDCSSNENHPNEKKPFNSILLSNIQTDETTLKNSGKELLSPESKGICHVLGKVTDSNGNIVPKAEITLRFTFDKGPEIWRTNALVEADGSYSALLTGLANLTPSTRSTVKLSGIARAPNHYCNDWLYADLPTYKHEKSKTTLNLILDANSTLKGRVLLADGKPCIGASVYLRSIKTRMKRSCQTNEDGCFVIPISMSGEFHISAIHEGKGVSDVFKLDLQTGQDSETPDLVLRGSGVIKGVVLYPNGKPAAGIKLVASSTQEQRQSYNSNEFHPISNEYIEKTGLFYGVTETDKEGRFCFYGLETGHYSIDYYSLKGALASKRQLYETGTIDASLVIQIYRVRLRVLDEKGIGIPGAKYSYSFNEKNMSNKRNRTINAEDGIAFINVSHIKPVPENCMNIEAWAPGMHPARTTISFEPEIYEPKIDLVLKRPDKPAIVRLSVHGDRRIIQEFTGEIMRDPGLREWDSFTSIGDDGIRTLTLPTGEYKISVTPQGEDFNKYFETLKEINVEEGQEYDLVFNPESAGRFRMVAHPPLGYTRKKLTLLNLYLKPIDEETSTQQSKSHKTIIDRRYLNRMMKDFRRNSSGINPSFSMPTPRIKPGRYTLYAKFDDCIPVKEVVCVQGTKIIDFHIHLLCKTKK